MTLSLFLLLTFWICCNGLKHIPAEHNLQHDYHYEIPNVDNVKPEMIASDFHPYTALKAKQLYTIAIPRIFNKDEHQHLYKKGGINYAHELSADYSTENILNYGEPSMNRKYYNRPSSEDELILKQPMAPIHYDKESQYSLSSETQLHNVYESPRYIQPSIKQFNYIPKQSDDLFRNNYNQKHYSPANEVSHVKFNGMGFNYEF